MQNQKNAPIKVGLINLGCKVNKYELDCMANILSNNGYQVCFEQVYADYYVLATCAVTNEAEKKSRQHIAKLAKLNPNAKIIVCGCASQNNAEQFKKQNVIAVIGNEGKDHILDLLNGNNFKPYEVGLNYNNNVSCPYKTQTRAYLKVQDGCNNFCSYCLIPYLRGRNRCRDFNDAINEAIELSKTSNEIVITGIDVSSYNSNGKDLGDLVYALKDINARIRLSSFEVRIISETFLQKLKETKNFCPHFHLSLQSGSTSELKRMNRHYTSEDYLNRINLIRKYFPDANITTDIIVGFPEQTDKEFNETLQTCLLAGFGHVHIFPYSVRNGTVAAKLKQVDFAIKKERVKQLTDVCKNNELKFYSSMINKTFTMLVEEQNNGMFEGYTENYIKVFVKHNLLQPNQFVKVKLTQVIAGGMLAEVIGD